MKTKKAFNIMKENSRKLTMNAQKRNKIEQNCGNLKRRTTDEDFALIDSSAEK